MSRLIPKCIIFTVLWQMRNFSHASAETISECVACDGSVVLTDAVAKLFSLCECCAKPSCQYFACAWAVPNPVLIDRTICRSTRRDSGPCASAGGRDNPKS